MMTEPLASMSANEHLELSGSKHVPRNILGIERSTYVSNFVLNLHGTFAFEPAKKQEENQRVEPTAQCLIEEEFCNGIFDA